MQDAFFFFRVVTRVWSTQRRMHYKWHENTAIPIQGILTTIHLLAVSGFYGNRGNCGEK